MPTTAAMPPPQTRTTTPIAMPTLRPMRRPRPSTGGAGNGGWTPGPCGGAGTCGAVLTRAAGVVNGREAIVVEHIIRMARDVAPDWPQSEFDATYRVDIEGEPDIHCSMNLGDAEGHGAGRAAMAATAMRVVNAIPFVVDAPTGLLSSLDMPNTLPRYAFD